MANHAVTMQSPCINWKDWTRAQNDFVVVKLCHPHRTPLQVRAYPAAPGWYPTAASPALQVWTKVGAVSFRVAEESEELSAIAHACMQNVCKSSGALRCSGAQVSA